MLVIQIALGIILGGVGLYALQRMKSWMELAAWNKRVVQIGGNEATQQNKPETWLGITALIGLIAFIVVIASLR